VTPGDRDKLKVGEWVAAIGSPFGLENTMTAGIVSGKRSCAATRKLRAIYSGRNVAINPGNSGGPLFKLGR